MTRASGWCIDCGHHEDDHGHPAPHLCDGFVRFRPRCECSGLKLCAACEGDPEAHDLHVCGREVLT